MNDDEELYREMNPEDPYYMGEKEEPPHESREWQKPIAEEKKRKEQSQKQFQSLSRREKTQLVLLAAVIWVPFLVFVLVLFFA